MRGPESDSGIAGKVMSSSRITSIFLPGELFSRARCSNLSTPSIEKVKSCETSHIVSCEGKGELVVNALYK